jgi:hypothetical protein
MSEPPFDDTTTDERPTWATAKQPPLERAASPVDIHPARLDGWQLRAELDHLLYVQADLHSVATAHPERAGELQPLQDRYRDRYAAVYEQWQRNMAAFAPAIPAPASVGEAPASTQREPWFREFLTDNALVLLFYLGAFALGIATLLFEVYTASELGGLPRFSVVAALDVAFLVAALLLLGRPKLHIIGRSYLVIFAVLTPLTGIAAYRFLELRQLGLEPSAATAVGAACCLFIYAALAHRVQALGYAVISAACLPVIAIAETWNVVPAEWGGVAVALTVPVYAAVFGLWRNAESAWRLFALVAKPAVWAASGLAVAIAVNDASQATQHFPYLTITLLIVGIGHAVVARFERSLLSTVIGVSLSAILVSIPWSCSLDTVWYGVALLVAAGLNIVALEVEVSVSGRSLLRALISVELLILLAVPMANSTAPAIIDSAAALMAVSLAIRQREARWLYLAAATICVAWYWLGNALIPSNTKLDALYSPLPLIFGFVAVGLTASVGRTQSRKWTSPLYAAAAISAGWVELLAAGGGDHALAGWTLVADTVVIVIAGWIENESRAALLSAVSLSAALLLLLDSAAASPSVFPYAFTLLAICLVACGQMLAMLQSDKGLQWGQLLRFSGGALSGVTAITCIALPDFLTPGAAGAISAFVAAAVFALLLALYARVATKPMLDYLAGVVASLAPLWLISFAGGSNPQAYVILPGVVAIGLGLLMLNDRRPGVDSSLGKLLAGCGVALLLGTTELQSLDLSQSWAAYTSELVMESLVVVFVAIGSRTKVLAIMGGAGLALAALHALSVVIQNVPLYVAFAVAAAILLVTATTLAAGRSKWTGPRASISNTWKNWR